ncbi:Ig-like domain-containing protein [uncultured Microbacterium sp.]|uniref:beta-galactosidase n=1 Tax=uncultured Microbacterium sp. TaxID=191216 RepID=UPI0026104648|nr:Ig-like domain-containing protein [uncultured Microbacterium sp.]
MTLSSTRPTRRRPRTAVAATMTVALALSTAAIPAAHAEDSPNLGDQTVLYDFDGSLPDPVEVGAYNASSEAVTIDGDQKWKVHFNAEAQYYSSFHVRHPGGLDLSGSESVGLSVELTNPGERSVQFHVDVFSSTGVATRAINVAAGSSGTYYVDIDSPANDRDSGLRADPSWLADKDVQQAVWMWGTKKLDPAEIQQVIFYVVGLQHDREVIIDDIAVVRDAPADPSYLTGLVDKFGQNAKMEYDGKISSAGDIKKQRKQEQADLAAHPELTDRSTYGGWADGPRLEATGHFRTEKLPNGEWTLVDPEGYLYFSTGIDNARLFDGQTMTGYDYDHALLPDFETEYVGGRTAATPEDLNRLEGPVVDTREKVNDIRTNLFEKLPKLNKSGAENYGYNPQTFAGPMEQGETFHFYRNNLALKYPSAKNTSEVVDLWQDNTVERMRSWGFTSFGNWADPELYDNATLPVFAHGWIIGDYKTVSTGQDYWGPLPDPFDSDFQQAARATAEAVAAETGEDNPWLVGVFMDNERSWGNGGGFATRYGIAIDTLGRDASVTPTKAEFSRLLKEKYGTIDALNTAWSTSVASWEEFDAGSFDQGSDEAARTADYAWLMKVYAGKYFAVVHDELERVLPDALYMGPRFASWGRTPEVLEAAAEYVDVMTYNEYREGLHPQEWAFLADLDKPSLIGEFHMGATTSGNPHPGLISAGSQAERGLMYREYMERLIDSPYMVGGHWFQYVDSPISGRQIDGENYNVGFVSVTDRPYPEMVDAARQLNGELYERRFGDLDLPTPDVTKPAVTLVRPSSLAPSRSASIQVDATDDRGLKKIVANIYQGSTLIKSTQTAVDGATSASHIADVSLSDGTYTLKYNAHDAAGNVSKTSTVDFVIDATPPTATIKDGTKFTVATGDSYDMVSFKLHDAGKVDKVEINGQTKDLSDNAWSDVNFVTPGVFGARSGQNTMIVFDRAGNEFSIAFTLN